MTDKLKHLSDSEVAQLIEDYYAGVRVAEVISKYQIDVLPGQLVKTFPPRKLETVCVQCGEQLMQEYLPKSSYCNNKAATCVNCGHSETKGCTCKGCKEAALVSARQQQEREALARQEWKSRLTEALTGLKKNPVPYDTLDFDQKVYIGAILRGAIDEGYNLIKPLSSLHVPFAPTSSYEDEILERVTKDARLLSISVESSSLAVFQENGEIRADS